MMRRLIPGLAAGLAIVVSGAVVSLLAERNVLPNPIFSATYQVDIAGLAFRAGLVLGALTFVAVLIVRRIRDTIERVRGEEQQAQISARQRFFQRLDHELKNPLTIIRLGIVNLEQSPGLSGEQASSLERISQQVQRLQKLVVDLRLLYELGRSAIEHKAIGLRSLLEEVIGLCNEAAESPRRITLNVQQVPWPVSDVWGDRDLLVLALRNLLDNALKFTRPDDSIEVRVSEDGRMAIVEVADSGPGILAEEVPHVFEELYRGENARGVPGSGLGLRLVERIVELHDGTVQVRSKPERGTVFTIRLPLAPEPG